MLALQWVLLRNLPSSLDLPMVVRAGGLLLVAGGLTVFFSAVFAFKRHETTICPFEDETREIISTGVFGWTRNPIYLGEAIMLAGTSLLWGHAWPFASVVLFIVGIDRSVITWEEATLHQRFGSIYDDYRRRTRRWL